MKRFTDSITLVFLAIAVSIVAAPVILVMIPVSAFRWLKDDFYPSEKPLSKWIRCHIAREKSNL